MKFKEAKIRDAMDHPDDLGAGAKKRKKLSPDEKFETVMREFANGTLYSGSGEKVTDKKQALAIAYSEKENMSESKRNVVTIRLTKDLNTLEKRLSHLRHTEKKGDEENVNHTVLGQLRYHHIPFEIVKT